MNSESENQLFVSHIFRRLIIFVLLAIMFPLTVYSHSVKTCWLILSDKDGMTLDPYSYFDQKAIERREKNNIPLVDYTDLPVRADYVAEIGRITDSIVYVSRWLNAVIVKVSDQEIHSFAHLPFVSEIWVEEETDIGQIAQFYSKDIEFGEPDEEIYKYFNAQTNRLNASEFRSLGIDGKGVRIAIFDIGFKSYLNHPAFRHIRDSGHIIKTWDFARNKENVDGHHSHGTMVMACVGGIEPDSGRIIGLATGAEFLLAITERSTERFKEEVNWLAAAEWADQNGADVINSSLGYTNKRYFRYDMDGKTSFVARAAKTASDKGILVVNSAGNEGADEWMNLGTPADVEEVLSVGGISETNGIHIWFSSFGPTWDKRMKPNVCAYGTVSTAGPKGYSKVDGTSFSSPLTAGFVACVMQMHPDWDRGKVFEEIQRSGDLYPYFDYAHGFGVPDAAYFTRDSADNDTTVLFKLVDHGKSIEIVFESSELETKSQEKSTDDDPVLIEEEPGYIYYHIENDRNYLDKYTVIQLDEPEEDEMNFLYENGPELLMIYKSDYEKPFTLRVFYKGKMIEYKCEE